MTASVPLPEPSSLLGVAKKEQRGYDRTQRATAGTERWGSVPCHSYGPQTRKIEIRDACGYGGLSRRLLITP